MKSVVRVRRLENVETTFEVINLIVVFLDVVGCDPGISFGSRKLSIKRVIMMEDILRQSYVRL
jgi:hypothetical protein